MEIKQEFLTEGEYFTEKTKKTEIVLHHTVSRGTSRDLKGYFQNSAGKVATHFGIDREGEIMQYLPLECWASHINAGDLDGNAGSKANGRPQILRLEKRSIGIELVSFGGLTIVKGKAYNAYCYSNNPKGDFSPKYEVKDDVALLPTRFRGFEAFQDYTEIQINALQYLLEHLKNELGIDVANNFVKTKVGFEVSQNAFQGLLGVTSHTNYRKDKSDVFPSPKLISMLNSLA